MVGIGIADALHDRDHAFIVEGFERSHPGIEADVRVDRKHVVTVDRQSGPHLIVAIVAVRHDAVEPVVASVQIDEHQTTIGAAGQPRQRRLRECAGENVIGIGQHRQSGSSR